MSQYSPENWFRTKQRDLHVIKYYQLNANNERIAEDYSKVSFYMLQSRRQAKTEKRATEMKSWFARHLPDTPLSIIYASEYSGFYSGGPSYITADFDREALATFEAAWEHDPAWQAETWSYSDWRKRVDSAELLPAPVAKLQKLSLWDTPQGVLLFSADKNGRLLSLDDGWWKLKQLFPEFAGCEEAQFPYGKFLPRDDNHPNESHELLVVLGSLPAWDEAEYINNPHNIQRLKDAIGISESTPLKVESVF